MPYEDRLLTLVTRIDWRTFLLISGKQLKMDELQLINHKNKEW